MTKATHSVMSIPSNIERTQVFPHKNDDDDEVNNFTRGTMKA